MTPTDDPLRGMSAEMMDQRLAELSAPESNWPIRRLIDEARRRLREQNEIRNHAMDKQTFIRAVGSALVGAGLGNKGESIMDDLNATIAKAKRAEAAEAERDKLKAENDAAWFDIEHGWDIEPRSYFEEAPAHGFPTALGHALHHCWKRTPKVQKAEAALAQMRTWLEERRTLMIADCGEEMWNASSYKQVLAELTRLTQGGKS